MLRASDQGPELALRFLLRHNQWSEAIRLLQQVGTNTPQHTSLFFLLLQHLLQVRTQLFGVNPFAAMISLKNNQ